MLSNDGVANLLPIIVVVPITVGALLVAVAPYVPRVATDVIATATAAANPDRVGLRGLIRGSPWTRYSANCTRNRPVVPHGRAGSGRRSGSCTCSRMMFPCSLMKRTGNQFTPSVTA